jgi:hypothetical protein
MDRETEITLALSSCPASVAGKAAVYALEGTGYVKVRDSRNGFTAIVQHSQPASQEPQCMDAEGTHGLGLGRQSRGASLCRRGRQPACAHHRSAQLPRGPWCGRRKALRWSAVIGFSEFFVPSLFCFARVKRPREGEDSSVRMAAEPDKVAAELRRTGVVGSVHEKNVRQGRGERRSLGRRRGVS